MAFLLALVVAVASVSTTREAAATVTVSRTVTVEKAGRYRGVTAAGWAAKYRHASSRYRNLRHVLFARPSVREAIDLAGATYGQSGTLWRKARCETGGTFSARSYNRSSRASGLFQFLPSTWASTPYARFSVWSPYANALAAGWMHARGRGGEWSCR